MFGNICLGCTREALTDAFGEPEDKGGTSRKYRRPAIWKYGDIEFFFSRDTEILWLIHIDHFSSEAYPRGWRQLELAPWIFQKFTPVDKITESLAAVQIDFISGIDPADPELQYLVFLPVSKLELRFAKSGSTPTSFGLAAISLSCKSPGNTGALS